MKKRIIINGNPSKEIINKLDVKMTKRGWEFIGSGYNFKTDKYDISYNKEMPSGSLESILYTFLQLLDEISHAVGLDHFDFGYRFCQWTHRYDS